MRAALRYLLLAIGLVIFGWFIYRAGSEEILSAFVRLGWMAPVVLVPYGIVYLIDTVGWHFAFGRKLSHGLRFLTLFRIRWAGEAVNNVLPSAYVGGEALKVYLLRKRGVSASNAAVSVVIGKTAQTLSQVIFICLGTVALVQLAHGTPNLGKGIFAVLVSAFAVAGALLTWQRYGLFAVLFQLADRLRFHVATFESKREKLLKIDRLISEFYAGEKRHFLLSVGMYFLGWLGDTMEICLVASLVGVNIHWEQALAVEAFVGVAKMVGLFVPGALGIQESGIVFLCRAVGLPEGFGIAYAIIRRGREVIYAIVGWALVYFEEVRLKGIAGRILLETKHEL